MNRSCFGSTIIYFKVLFSAYQDLIILFRSLIHIEKMNTLVVLKLNWPDAFDEEYLLAELHWICSYKKQILYYTDSQAKQTI